MGHLNIALIRLSIYCFGLHASTLVSLGQCFQIVKHFVHNNTQVKSKFDTFYGSSLCPSINLHFFKFVVVVLGQVKI